MYDDAQYAQGFLVNVYRCVPGYYDNSEYATDDAVINQKNNAFLTMATGGWTSRLWTPINQWTNSFSSIQYINLFLENVDKVRWSDDAEKAQLFARRTKGEAYGLRAFAHMELFRMFGPVIKSEADLDKPANAYRTEINTEAQKFESGREI